MKRSIKLVHKLALLISVPLLFELLFVVILVVLQQQVEQDAARANHSRAIVASANELERFTYEMVTVFFHRTGTPIREPGSGTGMRFRRLTDASLSELSTLRALVSGDRSEEEIIKQLALLHDEITRRVLATVASDQSLPPEKRTIEQAPRFDLGLYATLFATLGEFMDRTFDLTQQERDYQKLIPLSQNRWRQLIVQWLWLGVCASVAISGWLVFVIHKNFAARLERIVENTERLPEKKSLHEPVGGNDEIARVDLFFHKMAAALDEAAEEQRRLQQMKQDFLAMITHEIRSPLTSLGMFLQALSAGSFGALGEDVARRAKANTMAAERVIALVTNLLDLEKEDSGQLEIYPNTVPLARIIASSIIAVSNIAEYKGVQIAHAESDLLIYADEDRLVQVLINLLANALSYSPPGTAVTIDVTTTDKWVEISVQDSGPGISADLQAHIFDRFSQVPSEASRSRAGSGLGLAISRLIVAKHGGEIGVHSAAGEGSKFWFSIPIDCEEAELADTAATEP